MISKKCPTKEQLCKDVLSRMTWQEIAEKYGYKNSKFLENKARRWGLPDKRRKYSGFTKKNPSHKRIYSIWYDMKRRCYQPHNKRYGRYGGRGIVMCDEWKDDFQTFFDWSMMHGYDDKLTIDRIDMDGNYCPENCRWADIYEQANNRSNNHYVTYDGKTQTMKEWSDEVGLGYSTLRGRLNKGWNVERALFEPLMGDNK